MPERAVKPRENGLTMVIDGGVPLGLFADQIALGAEYIDDVKKFGWGTSVATNCLREKISVLDSHGIGYYFGEKSFDKFVIQGRFDDYRNLLAEYSCRHVEKNCNGTIILSNAEKAGYILTRARVYGCVRGRFQGPGPFGDAAAE